jgi:hypothetical protein
MEEEEDNVMLLGITVRIHNVKRMLEQMLLASPAYNPRGILVELTVKEA